MFVYFQSDSATLFAIRLLCLPSKGCVSGTVDLFCTLLVYVLQSDSATPFGLGGRRSQTPLGSGVGNMRMPYNAGPSGLGKLSQISRYINFFCIRFYIFSFVV